MRNTSRFVRTFAAASAIALTVAPAADAADLTTPRPAASVTCQPITRTGTYRIEISREGNEPAFALLVLERAAGCLSALLVTESGPTPLEITSVSADALTAKMGSGRKTVMSLRFTETGVTGELTARKRAFAVTGERTS